VVSLAAKWTGLSTVTAVTFGFAAALSSTALIFKMLEETRDSHSETAKRAVPVLIFQDMAVIPMILILTALSHAQDGHGITSGEFGLQAAALLAAKVLLCIGFVIVGSRFVFPWILEKVSKTGSRELFYFCTLFLAMGVGYLAIQLGFSVSLGAFIAGLMISESSWSKKALSEIMSMRDTFLGLFFIAIGLMVDPAMLLEYGLPIVLFALGVLAVKFVAIVLPCMALRVPISIAVSLACMLAHMGEFSFIIFNQAYGAGLMSEATYQIALGGACLSLLFAPGLHYLGSSLLKGGFFQQISVGDTWHQIQDQTLYSFPHHTEFVATGTEKKGNAILIGFGAAGENLADAFDALDIPFTAVDMSFKFFRPKSKKAAMVYGDASKPEILESAGIRTAKLVVITVSSAPMTQAILATVQHLRPDIHCVVRTQYLMEAKRLQSKHHFQLVVAEYETTLELLAQSLKTFGVSGQKINELLEDCRNRFSSGNLRLGDSLRRNVDTPPLKALRNIQPLQIDESCLAIGKTLQELDLRGKTGATVVAVFNEKEGAIVPGPDYELSAGDTLHMIGDKNALEKTSHFLLNPEPSTTT
jgi:CPA2 family monovalent cation:H+ antiporter-2